jgi:hypothetical protein
MVVGIMATNAAARFPSYLGDIYASPLTAAVVELMDFYVHVPQWLVVFISMSSE